nr:GAF domain-containing protein [Lysinibacillus timonensis]
MDFNSYNANSSGVVEYIKRYSLNKNVKKILKQINPLLAKNETNIRIHLEALRDSIITEEEFQTIVAKIDLGKLCLSIQEIIPDGYVTLLFYDERENNIYHAAAPNFPVQFFDFFQDINEANMFNANCGSCGAAVYLRKVIVTDIKTSPLWKPFREYMFKWGFQTCWSIPFFKDDYVIGTFAIYHKSRRQVQSKEIQLVKEKVKYYQETIFYMFNHLLEKEA